MARLFYAWVLALNGQTAAVRDVVAGYPAHLIETVPARIASFLAEAIAGHHDRALTALTPDIQAAANATDLFPRFLAMGYAVAGMPDEAIHWLTVAIDRGFINYPFLATHNPLMRSLRSHPRFKQLTSAVRARWQAFETA